MWFERKITKENVMSGIVQLNEMIMKKLPNIVLSSFFIMLMFIHKIYTCADVPLEKFLFFFAPFFCGFFSSIVNQLANQTHNSLFFFISRFLLHYFWFGPISCRQNHGTFDNIFNFAKDFCQFGHENCKFLMVFY